MGSVEAGIMRTQSRFRWVISAVSAVIFHGFRSWFLVGFCWVIYLIVYIYYVSYVDGYDLSHRWAEWV